MRQLQKTRAVPLSFVFCLLSFVLKAQINYVQNPSFENGPCTAANFGPVPPDFWDTLRAGGGGGPEYCTTCSSLPGTSVPKNGQTPSFQIPKSGNRYCFYTVYNPFPAVAERREYIQNQLKQNLISNKSYCVTYYLSLMNESKYAITEFGAYFDDGSIYTPYYGTSTVTPQVKSQFGVYITDTLNWVKIQGTFIANGSERYLTLGNFKTNANTDNTFVPSIFPRSVADYYIDDVSVIEADLPAFAGRDTVLCNGDSLFIGRPSEIGLDCIWFNNGSQIATGGGLWVKPVSTQTYEVIQDVCGLFKKDTIRVQIKPPYNGPAIGLSANTATACPSTKINLGILNNPPVTGFYNWLPLGVYTQTNISGANAMIPQSTTFTLNINNLGQDAFCPFQRTGTVSVSVPIFTDSPTLTSNLNPVCPNDTIVFFFLNPVLGNTVTVEWLPKSSFTYTNDQIAKSLTHINTNYSVNISSSGNSSICAFTRSISISINVADTCYGDPIIPNIFTPNNDNSNDVWGIKFPFGYSLQELEVYNRWGTLIYKRSPLNFDKQGYALIAWDGYTTSGEPCSPGVYFYLIKYTDRANEIKIAKGNVTLMR